MKKPYFSVIIPTLNEELFLPRLLKSLTKQTFKDFEVIIVDGKSTDKTKVLAEKVGIHFSQFSFNTVTKRNVSYQRNFGADKAKGSYLAFFDADATVPPTYLARMKQEIEKGACFLTSYMRPDSTEVYDEAIMRVANMLVDVSNFIGKPFVVGANIVVDKKLFKEIGGFDEHIIHAEDYELAQKVKRKHLEVTILKHPQLVFSLRRYHAEGRIKVLRKNAHAAFYLLLQGPITKDLFSYPMGGERYVKLKKPAQPLNTHTLATLEKQIKKMLDKLEFPTIRF